MIRKVIHWKLDEIERQLGQPVDYLRHIVNVSIPAFLKFVKIMPLAGYRKRLPVDAYHVAGIVASRSVDCGPCVQIAVNLALADRVDRAVLEAVVAGDPGRLPSELGDVYRFAEAVCRNEEDSELRERLRERYGEGGMIEMAYVIATARVFPTVKRVLGFARSCSIQAPKVGG
jgi:alkylhydroperoxidase family enzyme